MIQYLYSQNDNGAKQVLMSVKDIWTYIFKKSKTKNYGDVQVFLNKKEILPVAIDDSGVQYYLAFKTSDGKYLLG